MSDLFYTGIIPVKNKNRLLFGGQASPVMEIDSKVPQEDTFSDKVMKVRMLHCELKWEIPINEITAIGSEVTWVGGFLQTPELYRPILSVPSKG